MGRVGMIMTCRLCDIEGYNKRSCPQRMPTEVKFGLGKGVKISDGYESRKRNATSSDIGTQESTMKKKKMKDTLM
ncbi:hypothetical protein PTKIN_Ptkin08bG0104800 [Pterospermum kingtungense]